MTEGGGRARRHYNVTFALLALVAVSYALLQSLVAPALPDIQRALHINFNGVSWVLTAYLFAPHEAGDLSPREPAAASAVLSTLAGNDGTAAQRSIADAGCADR